MINTTTRAHLRLLILSVVLIVAFSRCNNVASNNAYEGLDEIRFGSSVYHPSWFFSEERNDTVTKVIHFEFNEFAIQKNAAASIQFINNDEEPLGRDGIEVFLNNELLKNDQFDLESSFQNGKVSLSLVLPSDKRSNWMSLFKNKKRYYSGYLKFSRGSLDRINNVEEISSIPFMKWDVTQVIKMNPIKRFFYWLAIGIVGIILTWKVLINPIVFPKIKRQSITISSPFFKKIRTKRLLELTLTNGVVKKQSLLKRFFLGKKESFVHSFFTHPILITQKSKKSIRIKIGSHYTITPYTSQLKPQQTYTLTNNDTQEKITIS